MEFKMLHENAYRPAKAHEYDAGFDMFSRTSVLIPAKEGILVPTGIAIHIPKDHVGLLFSRSGMGKLGIRLSNCVGVIDSGYLGEIGVLMRNDSENNYVVTQGDRIAQLVILPIATVELEWVQYFSEDSERGAGGFGSSGT